jgi:gliding motility-associated-like protein
MKTFTENNFDELFKERFSNFGENPPESVLQRIKNTASSIPQHTPFWKKGGFFASIGGAIILISGILVINSFSTNTDKVEQNNVLAENQSNSLIATENNVIDNNIETVTVSNENNINTDSKEIKNETVINKIASENNDNKIANNNTPDLPVTNKNIQANNNSQDNIVPNSKFSITVNVKASTCRKANGKATLTADDQTVKFYWVELDPNNPTNSKENLSSGTYNVKAINVNGIVNNFTVIIPDSGIIRTRFTHYEMTQTIGVPVYFTNKTTVDGNNFEEIESLSFKWYFGDGQTSNEINPEHLYNSTGPFVISLVVNNSIGCKDSNSVAPLYIAESNIDNPNIFTPNGDGIFDVFKPSAQGMKTFQCTIFNRNGTQIYEYTNPEQGWDGKINHGLQMATPGTYFYIIKGVGIDGKIISIKQSLDIRY